MSFTDDLRARVRTEWDQAVRHRFVTELCVGSIDDAVMAGYLVQDYRFIDAFLSLIGAAIASADRLDSRLSLATFAGEIAGDENTYFVRSFEALGVSDELREATPDSQATSNFQALMMEAAQTHDYVAALSVLTVAEWLYSDWGTAAPDPRPGSFVHAEWIELHDFPGFHDRVAFLRAELDRVGPGEAEVAMDFFARAVHLERAFFDAAYDHPLEDRRLV